ncbi:MAG: iron chaperone [Chloroflexota bacterium]
MADTKKTATRDTSSEEWTKEERAAMKEHAAELKKARGRGKASKADGEADVLEKIAEMPESDRSMAERIHSIVKESGPDLVPRTWYGMPAYSKDGKVLCYFQSADKFKARYATFGFDQAANLDKGSMWPTSWALTKLTAADEKQLAELVKKAVS